MDPKHSVIKGLPCTYIKSWKNIYKIRLQRDIFETCSKWLKWQEVSVDIKILSPGSTQFAQTYLSENPGSLGQSFVTTSLLLPPHIKK